MFQLNRFRFYSNHAVTNAGRKLMNKHLSAALKELKFQKMTPIQELVMPHLFSGQDVLFGAETGSGKKQRAKKKTYQKKRLTFLFKCFIGKTLAFLLPLMAQLKEKEVAIQQKSIADSSSDEEVLPVADLAKPNRPRAIVIVPSRELVHQIALVAKSLSHCLQLRVRALSSFKSAASQVGDLAKPIDVLVTTPGRFTEHRKQSNHRTIEYLLKKTKYCQKIFLFPI